MNPNKVLLSFILLLGIFGHYLGSSLKSNLDPKLFISTDRLLAIDEYEKTFGSEKQFFLFINSIVDNPLGQFATEEIQVNSLTHLFPESKINVFSNVFSNILSVEFNNLEPLLISNTINNITAYLEQQGLQWTAVGQLWTNHLLRIENEKIRDIVFPILFSIIGILIFLFIGNLKVATLIFISSLICTGHSFIFLQLLKGETHLLTSLIPLINFIIPMAVAFHLFYGIKDYDSWEITWRHKKKSLLLTSITTLSGFGSLAFSSIQVIIDFGVLCFVTLLWNFGLIILICYLLAPYLKSMGRPLFLRSFHIDQIRFPFKKNKNSVLILWMISISSLPLATYLISTFVPVVEAERFFASNHPIHQGLENAQKIFKGVPLREWIISKPNNEKIEYTEMMEIDELLSQLIQNDTSSYSYISASKIIKEANRKYTGEYKMPSLEISARTLYNQVPSSLRGQGWKSNKLKVTLLGNFQQQSKEMEDKLTDALKLKLGNKYSLISSGHHYQLIQSQRELIHSLLISFLVSFLISTLIVAYYLRSMHKIAAFIVVNLAPIAFAIFCFGPLGLELTMSTVMAFSVSFGLIVDGTIHLLLAPPNATARQIDHIKDPIFVSNALLITSFALLGLHAFSPIWQFGSILSIILFFGLIYDLIILKYLENNN
jgi:predicted RND superfamily exporter protein